MGDKKQHSRPKRIFINDVDTYSSKHITQFLSRCAAANISERSRTESVVSTLPEQPAFHIVGTSSVSAEKQNESPVLKTFTSPSRDELLKHLLQCDVVVYNVSEGVTKEQVEEANWAITALHAHMGDFKSRKMFILVSSVMTWAMTKTADPEDPDCLLTEEEFKRRRPHPRFRTLKSLENLVLQLGRGKKSKISGYVVACGVQYGKGENLFHYFFKMSWLMELPEVPLFGAGTNFLPTIHVCDLAGVLQNIMELKPKSRYILAVDDSKNTLEQIVTRISETLGPGKIRKVPEDEAISVFQLQEWTYLSMNLRLESVIIKDLFSLQWVSEDGMVDNMENVVEEYKDTRQLLPIRICLFGPPAVGKSRVAEKLCRHYKLHHVKSSEVIEERITQLKEIVSKAESEYVSEEEVANVQIQLDNLIQNMEINAGRLADHQFLDILKTKLISKPCRNQGFVLDGFPKTLEQAKSIFSDEDAEEVDSMSQQPVCNKTTAPEHVFVLNAPDEFLMKRVQGLPQSVAEKKHYTEDEFLVRLRRYRQLNAAEDSLLDYFDELEIHPQYIEVSPDDSEYKDVVKKIVESVGKPKNYGLSKEEQQEEDRKREEERKQKVAQQVAERKRRNDAALADMAVQYKEWQENLYEVKLQEKELVEAQALPLRNYLMKYVMPSLKEALLHCSKIKPEDPVDFVAEHLLRNSHRE